MGTKFVEQIMMIKPLMTRKMYASSWRQKLSRHGIALLLTAGVFLPGMVSVAAEQVETHQPMTGDEIAEQIFQAAHGGLVDNAMTKKHKREVALLVNRSPLEIRNRAGGKKPSVLTFEMYLNNKPEDPAIDTLQMAVIKSGKIKGTGLLFTTYTDKSHDPDITIWLPALRKVRKMNSPSHEDTWAGSNLTYGELVLRRPEHEVHELIGEDVFADCLPVMELKKSEKSRYTKKLPQPQCGHKGKPVYILKSTTKFKNWWYDYHISEVDKETFSLYRTVYFKDEEKLKTVVVDWQSLDQPDPRIAYPRYIYAQTHTTGADSMIYVPRNTIHLNVDIDDDFWSVKTLKKLGKK